jgi:hypothetical protein
MIVECTPRGWLDTRQVHRLQRRVQRALRELCDALLLSGNELRYRDAEGLAQFVIWLDTLQRAHPTMPIWLCHLAPDLLAALHLADLGTTWHIVPDRATALRALATTPEEIAL